MSQKCKFCFLLYLKEIYAQFVETNVPVKHKIYHELRQTIMDLDLQITRKHPVVISIIYANFCLVVACANMVMDSRIFSWNKFLFRGVTPDIQHMPVSIFPRLSGVLGFRPGSLSPSASRGVTRCHETSTWPDAVTHHTSEHICLGSTYHSYLRLLLGL